MLSTTDPVVAHPISSDKHVALGLIRTQDRNRTRFVAPAPQDILPSRHEVIDPYAPTYPQPVEYLVRHEYSPISRAHAMLLKTSAVTVFLSILTGVALMMLDSWSFLAWLFLASLEWVFCFVLLAILDWR